MKRILSVLCLVFVVMTVHARGIREEADLDAKKERESYAFGMVVGGDLQQAGLEIDYEAFTQGLRAAMEQEKTRLDRDEALEIVQDAFENAMTRQAEELRVKEEMFLAANAANPGVITTESGLQYLVLEEGDGPKPNANDTVKVHYEGALTDGSVFDSSYSQGQPEEISLDMVIPGWAEGIQLMSVGSKYRIFIPSYMAYGERGAGQIIPPYSTLIFTIDLLEIIRETGEDAE